LPWPEREIAPAFMMALAALTACSRNCWTSATLLVIDASWRRKLTFAGYGMFEASFRASTYSQRLSDL
jgi:hypothetical protein